MEDSQTGIWCLWVQETLLRKWLMENIGQVNLSFLNKKSQRERERDSRNLFPHKLLTKSPLLSLHPCVNSLSLLVNFSNFSPPQKNPIVYPRTWPKKKMSWGMLGVGLLSFKNWLFSGSTLVGGLVNSNFQWQNPNYCWWNFMNSH